MKDEACIEFLQWCLPLLRMRWAGFRKVRKQVCKRLQRRLDHLQLKDLQLYRLYLESHPDEWPVLDSLCQITISRFYRDKLVFSFLEEQVFPRLLNSMHQRQQQNMRVWCVGSGAGEEPYTLALVWAKRFESKYHDTTISIIGSEINTELIERAERACYPYSAIKNLPSEWQHTSFSKENDHYCLHPKYQRFSTFHCQDIRKLSLSDNILKPYHLISCRNLAFTYFDIPLQQDILKLFHAMLEIGGALMIGVHEKPPNDVPGFMPLSERLGIYLRTDS